MNAPRWIHCLTVQTPKASSRIHGGPQRPRKKRSFRAQDSPSPATLRPCPRSLKAPAGSLGYLGVFKAWQSANCLFVGPLQHDLVISANELGDRDYDPARGNTEKLPNR